MATMEEAKEFFIKTECDTHTKEEIAESLWKMGYDNEGKHNVKRELEELQNEK